MIPTPSPAVLSASPEPPAAPTEAPAETLTPVEYAPGSLEALICSLPWPCAEAIHVAACESGRDMSGNLDGAFAVNWWTGTALEGDGVFGLFQIALPLHGALLAQYGEWSDPLANAQAAFDLYAGSGWSWAPHWAAACRPW